MIMRKMTHDEIKNKYFGKESHFSVGDHTTKECAKLIKNLSKEEIACFITKCVDGVYLAEVEKYDHKLNIRLNDDDGRLSLNGRYVILTITVPNNKVNDIKLETRFEYDKDCKLTPEQFNDEIKKLFTGKLIKEIYSDEKIEQYKYSNEMIEFEKLQKKFKSFFEDYAYYVKYNQLSEEHCDELKEALSKVYKDTKVEVLEKLENKENSCEHTVQ